jgi:hypothetical protein
MDERKATFGMVADRVGCFRREGFFGLGEEEIWKLGESESKRKSYKRNQEQQSMNC